jgi:hypothetical protein
MSQATITIPAELRDELEAYARRQNEPPELSAVVRTALLEFLARHEERAVHEYRPFRITPIEEKDDLGESDVSVNHDKYFAEATYDDSFNER